MSIHGVIQNFVSLKCEEKKVQLETFIRDLKNSGLNANLVMPFAFFCMITQKYKRSINFECDLYDRLKNNEGSAELNFLKALYEL